MNNRALVLFSGGQDSTVCLAWALQKFDYVETIGFDYGQRHKVELSCRLKVREAIAQHFPQWRSKFGKDHVLDVTVLGRISETSLTQQMEIKLNKDGLPNTFVPGRNLIFFNFAAAVAYRIDTLNLVGGMCETDFSGYPDCRDESLKALEHALNLGMAAQFKIHTPLMWVDKAGTWRMAQELGGEPLITILRDETHSCYLGTRGEKHEWGYGCGTCPACELRRDGYRKFVTK